MIDEVAPLRWEGGSLLVLDQRRLPGEEAWVLLQGARLTAWELGRAGIPFKVIADAAAGGLIAAFDVTPAELVTALITERGVLEPPYEESIPRVASR